MKKQRMINGAQGKIWKMGTVAAVLFVTMIGASPAAILFDDNFNTYDTSVWTAHGTVGTDLTFGGSGLSLRTATTGNPAAVTSNSSYDGSTGTLTLTMTMGSGNSPDDFLGFINASNFGGSGTPPFIIFRTDQVGSGGVAYLSTQVYNGGSINDLRNSSTLLASGQVLGISWSPTQILFSVNGTVIETYNDAITGPQNVQLGQFAPGNANTIITNAELQSVPEPSMIALMAIGLSGLLIFRGRRAKA